jgi:hypothetical protein
MIAALYARTSTTDGGAGAVRLGQVGGDSIGSRV